MVVFLIMFVKCVKVSVIVLGRVIWEWFIVENLVWFEVLKGMRLCVIFCLIMRLFVGFM